MTAWQVILPWLPAMAALLIVSALFSGSEAAYFSLRSNDLRELKRRGGWGRFAARLSRDPETLLSVILFWNLMVNMVYFSIAGIVGSRLESSAEAGGGTAAVTFTAASLLTIIFCGEMVPKSIAVLAPTRIAMLAGLPMTLAVRITRPVLPTIRMGNLVARRLLWPTFAPEPEISLDDISRAIELGTDDAALAQREQTALKVLVALAAMRVDECMTPRSRLQTVRLPLNLSSFPEGLSDTDYLLVMESEGEIIVGAIDVSTLRPSHLDDISEAMDPVIYVPWSSTVSSTLDFLRQQEVSVAVVVNEFGDNIGILSIDDIVHQVVLGQVERSATIGTPSIREVGEKRWMVQGETSLRRLSRVASVALPEGRGVSVAGMMTRLLSRPPRIGDSCPWSDLMMTVVENLDDDQLLIEVIHRDAPQADQGVIE